MQLFQTTSSFFNCFFFVGSHAKRRCKNRQRSRLQRSEKHICQSETKFYYMKLHLSFKYPQNVEMFHFQPNGKTKNERFGSVRNEKQDTNVQRDNYLHVKRNWALCVHTRLLNHSLNRSV